MLNFLDYVLPRLPPLIIGLHRDIRPKVVVYSDAMQAGGVIRIGWCVWDISTNEVYHSSRVIDRQYAAAFFGGAERVIMQARYLPYTHSTLYDSCGMYMS